MTILGLILSIFVAVSAAALLATTKDDALAKIVGTVLIILGPMWCVIYSAMLMGW